jgi:hypothetical protein
MSRCARCNTELPDNMIHLSRDWPGRLDAVNKAFPNTIVSLCKKAVKYDSYEKALKSYF